MINKTFDALLHFSSLILNKSSNKQYVIFLCFYVDWQHEIVEKLFDEFGVIDIFLALENLDNTCIEHKSSLCEYSLRSFFDIFFLL